MNNLSLAFSSNEKLKLVMKKVSQYVSLTVLAIVSALSYVIFVFPNNFAPAGFNGIATIIQHIFHINAGYMSILLNIPLVILVFFLVDKQFALNTFAFLLIFSGSLVVFQDFVDLSWLMYATDNGTSTILGPIVAGIISGYTVGKAVLINCCSGGTDLCAALVHKFKPNYDFAWVAFILNASVAVVSFFVYGKNLEPVILSIIYSFFTSTITDKLIKGSREAIKFEVVTNYPEEVGKAIIERLGHSATVLRGEGAYTGAEKGVVLCVINKDEIVSFKKILLEFPDTFAYASNVNFTVGKFKNPRPQNDKIA